IEYDAYVPCINKVGRKLKGCTRSFIQALEAVAHHASKKERIPYGCCFFDQYVDCTRDAIGNACTREHVEYGDSIMQSMSGTVLSKGCSTYKHRAKVCTDLGKLPIQEPEATTFNGPLLRVFEPFG
ncbi:hypothetical protein BIW11_05430, partial [Tropilaelaps mercedesae]